MLLLKTCIGEVDMKKHYIITTIVTTLCFSILQSTENNLRIPHINLSDLNEWKEKLAQEDLENRERVNEIAAENQPLAIEAQVSNELVKELSVNYLSYPSSHSGAYHVIQDIAANGSAVEIEDGSVWEVKASDRKKVSNWQAGDKIAIVANRTWFSSYLYKLVNFNSLDIVPTNLLLFPFLDSLNTRWIERIDYDSRTLVLNDGSKWSVSRLDKGEFKHLKVFDVIVIGVNDGWWRSYNPNILIQVNTMKYVRAERMF